MCGITGWVSYDRDLTAERATLEAMTQTMACRGPDAAGIWLDAHVGLGHRRLAVIDIEGGRQPMCGRAGRPDGARDDVQRRDLQLPRAAGRAAPPAATSSAPAATPRSCCTPTSSGARASPSGSTACTPSRSGTRASEQLLLVRDRMGIKPLYYYPTADGVLFGSEPKAILAHPQVRPVVDTDGLRRAAGLHQDARARGLPGNARGAARPRRSGAPRGAARHALLGTRGPRAHRRPGHHRRARCASCWRTSCARQLVADVPLCTLLSGGLDSSVITALAARGWPPRARTGALVRRGLRRPHRELPADDMRADPGRPVRARLAEHVGAEHTDIVLDTTALMDRGHRGAVLAARDLPHGLGDMDTSLYLLFRAIREQSTVALSGESADEVFGGYRWFHDAGRRRADTFPWLAARTMGGFRAPVRRPRVPARPWAARQARPGRLPATPGTARRWPRSLASTASRGHERRMREICYLHLTRFVQILLDRKDRMSMAVGLEVRVPFCDHRLVEYVFNAPWAMKTLRRPGEEPAAGRHVATCCRSPWRSGSRAPTRPPRTRATPTSCATS